jgi:hypothetical protein
MNLNDPLKSSAQGHKSDYTNKISNINNQDTHPKHKRYYPFDNRGNIDEWKAIVETQVIDAGTKKMQEQKHKKDIQNTYCADLGFMRNNKNEEKLTHELIKASEKEELDMAANMMNKHQEVLNREAKKYRSSIGEDYIQQIANNKRQKLEEKLRNINAENEHIHFLKKVAAKEKFSNTLTKVHLKTDQDSNLKLRQIQK